MISGILFNYDKTKNIKIFFIKKFKSLIIPYFTFGSTIILLGLLIEHSLTGEIKSYILFLITGVGLDALWFLPALFISELLFKILNSKIKNKYFLFVTLIIFFLIGLLGKNIYSNMILITIYRSFIGLGFFSMGYYVFKYIDDVTLSYPIITTTIVFNFFLSQINRCVDLWSLNFNNYFLYFFCSALGSLSMIFIFKKCIHIYNNKTLIFFGKNSLIIMATQQFIIDCINSLTKEFTYGYFIGFLIFLIIIIIEVPLIKLINSYLPFMLGKKNNKIISIKI